MNRTLLILSGALIVAAGAVYYVYADTYVREETGGERLLVVTAVVDIPFGEPIQAAWLTAEELPETYVEERHLRISEMRQLVGVPLAQSVRAGEAVLRTDLSSLSDQQRTLSAEIPEGRRAVSLHALPISTFGGLLRPGDRVDALLVAGDYRIPNSGRSMVLAQNLLVLAVGQTMGWDRESDPEGRRIGAQVVVSLQCELDDAQRLTLAHEEGNVQLLLRNANDGSELGEPPEVREAELYDRRYREGWLRRFAMVESPEPEVLRDETGEPIAPTATP